MTRAAARGLSESEEDRAFRQRRLAQFGLVIGVGYLFFWFYRVAILFTLGDLNGFRHPSFWWHLCSAACFLLLGFSCARSKRSRGFMRAAELVSLSLGVVATGAMAMYIPAESRPDFILLLALSNVIVGRAVFVPSSGRWTLALDLVVGTLLLSCVFVGALRLDLDKWSVLYPHLSDMTPQRVAAGMTIEIGAWWAVATLLSTATSVVIYGLRRRVRDAEQLGQYQLEEKLGEGGMGVVYRARHALLRRPTAVKLLPPDRAGGENLRRFEQEVQLTAGLSHPHTITIFDYGHTSDGLFYYAMEYIDGLTLTDLVERSGAQDQARVLHLIRQAASALVEAHGVGLVHRDIKPGNIMVHLSHAYGGGDDFVKVLDFGLVKEVRTEGGIELSHEAILAGTPQYMAPESIVSPEAVDGRVDLYALGAVAYYLLTGTHVFNGMSVAEVCSHHLYSAPESLSSRLGTPVLPELEKIVSTCLAKDPSERPQTASALEQLLVDCSSIAGSWTPDDAQRWWSAHGERARVASPKAGGALTIDVQLTSADARD
jgi:serine/threonine-protein kinase